MWIQFAVGFVIRSCRPFIRTARSEADVARVVYETLRHELAHHLGMNEQEVREAERKRGHDTEI